MTALSSGLPFDEVTFNNKKEKELLLKPPAGDYWSVNTSAFISVIETGRGNILNV